MHGLNRRSILALALGMPALASGFRPAAAQAQGPSDYLRRFAAYREEAGRSADYLPDVEAEILAQTNARREEAGAPPLQPDPHLVWIARFYGNRLAAHGRIRHEDEAGRTPDQRIAILHRRHIGPSGENLFQSNLFRRSEPRRAGRLAVDSLMNSPGHRENILKPDWTHAGIGAVTDETSFFVVQLFIQRAALLAEDAPVRLAPGRPAPAATTRFDHGAAELAALAPMGRPPPAPTSRPWPGLRFRRPPASTASGTPCGRERKGGGSTTASIPARSSRWAASRAGCEWPAPAQAAPCPALLSGRARGPATCPLRTG